MNDLKRETPKTLEECMEVNSTAKNVKEWAGNVDDWGSILLFFVIVVGIISIVISAGEMYDYDEDLVVGTIISGILSWGLYAIIEYYTYKFISMLLYALASIIQSVHITSNVALFKSSILEHGLETFLEPDDNVEGK